MFIKNIIYGRMHKQPKELTPIQNNSVYQNQTIINTHRIINNLYERVRWAQPYLPIFSIFMDAATGLLIVKVWRHEGDSSQIRGV